MKTSITNQNKGFAVLGFGSAKKKTQKKKKKPLYTKTKNGYAIFSLENF
jgi:hypothetical protein